MARLRSRIILAFWIVLSFCSGLLLMISLAARRTISPSSSLIGFYLFFLFFMLYISRHIIPKIIPVNGRIEPNNGFLKIIFMAMAINIVNIITSVYSNNLSFFCIVRGLRFHNGITHTFKMKVCVIRFFYEGSLKVNVSTVGFCISLIYQVKYKATWIENII